MEEGRLHRGDLVNLIGAKKLPALAQELLDQHRTGHVYLVGRPSCAQVGHASVEPLQPSQLVFVEECGDALSVVLGCLDGEANGLFCLGEAGRTSG